MKITISKILLISKLTVLKTPGSPITRSGDNPDKHEPTKITKLAMVKTIAIANVAKNAFIYTLPFKQIHAYAKNVKIDNPDNTLSYKTIWLKKDISTNTSNINTFF